MTNSTLSLQERLKLRQKDRWQSLLRYQSKIDQKAHGAIICSSSDLGVALNGGRVGAKWGPKALLHSFGQMIKPPHLSSPVPVFEVAPAATCEEDFEASQIQQADSIVAALESLQGHLHQSDGKILHLGGGHDHIYPYFLALQKWIDWQEVLIINIDAHLDTRNDNWSHSGTPFRQMAHQSNRPISIYQWGIHSWSNPASNYQDLKGKAHQYDIVGVDEIEKNLDSLLQSIKVNPHTQIILSLDADALCLSAMEAVSAPNAHGLSTGSVNKIIQWANHTNQLHGHYSIMGIYEYNPLFDNLSQKGARVLGQMIHQFFLH